jgi:hypothetical protein
MKEPMVKFPVVCPKCGNEHLTEVPIAVVADALIKNECVYLRAVCHDAAWNASPTEIEQSRQYMGAPWIDAARA